MVLVGWGLAKGLIGKASGKTVCINGIGRKGSAPAPVSNISCPQILNFFCWESKFKKFGGNWFVKLKKKQKNNHVYTLSHKNYTVYLVS